MCSCRAFEVFWGTKRLVNHRTLRQTELEPQFKSFRRGVVTPHGSAVEWYSVAYQSSVTGSVGDRLD